MKLYHVKVHLYFIETTALNVLDDEIPIVVTESKSSEYQSTTAQIYPTIILIETESMIPIRSKGFQNTAVDFATHSQIVESTFYICIYMSFNISTGIIFCPEHIDPI